MSEEESVFVAVADRSGESLDTRTTATILAKNRELQRVSSALAAKAGLLICGVSGSSDNTGDAHAIAQFLTQKMMTLDMRVNKVTGLEMS